MKEKISIKILLAVLIITIFSALISGGYAYIFQLKENNKTASETLESTSEQIGSILKTSLYLYDDLTAKSICMASFSDQNIFSIRMFDTGFDEMNFTIRRDDFQNIPSEMLSNINRHLVFIEKKIYYEEEYIGSLEIGMTKYYLINSVRRQLCIMVIQLLANCLIIVLFLFIFLERIYVSPVIQITKVANQIAEGAFSGRISIKNRDELGSLAKTINSMAQTIDEKISELRMNMEEKNVLIMEIHHRVKNNLAIINSIMNLQAQKFNSDEVYNALMESGSVIYSLSLVHEQLFRSEDLSHINIGEYIRQLAEHLKYEYSGEGTFEIRTDIDEVALDINQSTPLGILMNELITNVFKHAYSNEPDKFIQISLKRISKKSPTIRLTVSDGGKGLPPEINTSNPNSLGLTLVLSLATQLNAKTVISENEPRGTSVSVTFTIK